MSRHGRRGDERFRLGPWLVLGAVVAMVTWLALVVIDFLASTTFVG